MRQIVISVRNIVELVLRSGDIDSGFLSARRMQDGIRIHQKIQRRRKKEAKLAGGSYESEVTLGIDYEFRGFVFRVEGRADGMFVTEDGGVGIEEIKSTSMPIDAITAPEIHWAQAKLYAYMYCVANGAEKMHVQLTYCNFETEETIEAVKTYSVGELQEYFHGIIELYYGFASMDEARINERLKSAAELRFPYPSYRLGQRELAAAVYRTISHKRALYAQAPTGTGKTISALFPAVKALGEGKIFYLTAKTVTRRVAAEALLIMQNHGLAMRSIVLTAKDKICFSEGKCNPIDCEFAAGHFDRVNAAIIDIITNEQLIRRDEIEEYSLKHKICPFEFALDISEFCDCIICDYNHVYDPKTQLRRFFGESADKRRGDIIVLNDEAHNLVERAREMFSAELSGDDFGLRGMFRGNNKRLYTLIGKIRDWLKKIEGISLVHALPVDFIPLLYDFVPQADKWLAENKIHSRHTEFLELYFRVLDFLRISELFDERYVIILNERDGIKLLCLDPSFLLSQTYKKLRAAVFFSATLTPLTYFRDVFGGTPEDYGVRLGSPFPKSNLCLTVARVDTTYKNRQNSIEPVVEYIHKFISARAAGNYMIFFSSYEYMNSVHERFLETYPDIEPLLQTPAMDEGEKESFLARFIPEPKTVLAAFVVMGGIFSEGIDLAGERLCGAAIVGVGLPTISAERNILSDYYKAQLGNGFEYAYMYQGMNKVLQAAGRVIRTENDRGAVLLIDSRFTRNDYRQLFPDEWSHWVGVPSPSFLSGVLEEFWNENIADAGV